MQPSGFKTGPKTQHSRANDQNSEWFEERTKRDEEKGGKSPGPFTVD